MRATPRLRAAVLATLATLVVACSDRAPDPDRGLPGDRAASSVADDGTPPPPPLDVPADAPVVAFLGDSISAGLHLPADQAFPAVLQRLLFEEGLPFRLVNAGSSGDTAAGGLRRLAWIQRSAPAVVVIELGGNDALRGQELASIEENLRALVAGVRAGGARPLLLGMRIPTSYGEPYAEDFAALYARVAEDLDVPFVPFFMSDVAGVPELMLPDGLHPTAEGHRLLARRLAAPLRALLE